MIIKVILGVVIFLISFFIIKKVIKKFEENKLKLTLIILSIIVLFLVVTGRAHWLYASIVALIPLARKIMFIFRQYKSA